jgi:hypothetical protein
MVESKTLKTLSSGGVILSRGSSLEIPVAELKHSSRVPNHINGSKHLK